MQRAGRMLLEAIRDDVERDSWHLTMKTLYCAATTIWCVL